MLKRTQEHKEFIKWLDKQNMKTNRVDLYEKYKKEFDNHISQDCFNKRRIRYLNENPLRNPNKNYKEVTCLKCKCKFISEADKMNIPYKRICNDCHETNKKYRNKNMFGFINTL